MKQQYELYLRLEFFFKVRYFLISFKYEKKDNILALQCWPIHRNTIYFSFTVGLMCWFCVLTEVDLITSLESGEPLLMCLIFTTLNSAHTVSEIKLILTV